MSFTTTTNTTNSRLSRLARIATIGLIAAFTLLTALTDSSDARGLSKGRAMGIANKIAKSEAREAAAYLEQDVGGSWYGSGWANRCKVRSARTATCRITIGALSPEYGKVRCTATASIRVYGSSYRYRLANYGGDCG